MSESEPGPVTPSGKPDSEASSAAVVRSAMAEIRAREAGLDLFGMFLASIWGAVAFLLAELMVAAQRGLEPESIRASSDTDAAKGVQADNAKNGE